MDKLYSRNILGASLANPSLSKIYAFRGDLPGSLRNIVKPTAISEIISRPFCKNKSENIGKKWNF